MNSFVCLIFSILGVVMGVATTLNAYGLTIVSWPWLIMGLIVTAVFANLATYFGSSK